MSSAFAFPDDLGRRASEPSRTALRALPRLHELDPVDRLTRRWSVDPTVCAPGRATVDRRLAAQRWLEFSTGAELPDHWSTGQRLAVQVPCESRHHEDAADGAACQRCDDGLVTVAWATTELGPLRVVDYRYRLRRSKPNQFKLADGTYHDLTSDIEPICLPGRWARGGTISIERP